MRNFNQDMKGFIESHTLEQIDLKQLKRNFTPFNKIQKHNTDEYSLLHIISDDQYDDIDKTIKITKLIIESSEIDLNYKEPWGGYTFIHLAFYSNYPLKYFQEIIPLATKNGFNINAKDNDGDTILHSAIYSEDYLDKIFPLFSILEKENFNFCLLNNNKESLIDALDNSINEAKSKKNKDWFNQLQNESEKITTFIQEKFEIKDKKQVSQTNKTELKPKNIEEKISRLERLDKQKLEQKKLEEYRIFLSEFNEKLKHYSSLKEAKNLIKLADNIKELDDQKSIKNNLNKVVTDLQKNYNNFQHSLNKLQKLCDIKNDNSTILKYKKQIDCFQSIEAIPIDKIDELTIEINQYIEHTVNAMVTRTMRNIDKSLTTLSNLQEFVPNDLKKEVKIKIKNKLGG